MCTFQPLQKVTPQGKLTKLQLQCQRLAQLPPGARSEGLYPPPSSQQMTSCHPLLSKLKQLNSSTSGHQITSLLQSLASCLLSPLKGEEGSLLCPGLHLPPGPCILSRPPFSGTLLSYPCSILCPLDHCSWHVNMIKYLLLKTTGSFFWLPCTSVATVLSIYIVPNSQTLQKGGFYPRLLPLILLSTPGWLPPRSPPRQFSLMTLCRHPSDTPVTFLDVSATPHSTDGSLLPGAITLPRVLWKILLFLFFTWPPGPF